jgi:hypothetical protein
MNYQIVTALIRAGDDQIVTGIVSGIVSGLVVAVVSGVLFVVVVPRLVRKLGKVDCELSWKATQRGGSPDRSGESQVLEPRLTVTFTNHKDVRVTVRSMAVVFYRQGEALGAGERPHVQFTRDGGGPRPSFELVSLPTLIPVTRTVIVSSGQHEHRRQKAVEEAARIEFVAVIEGAKDIRTRLAPWTELEPLEKRC